MKEESESSGELEKYARRIANGCFKTYKVLARIETALDEEREFFLEYSPAHLEQRIRIENSLDAQFDKLCARLVIAREARMMREKLAAGSSPIVQSHEKVVTKRAANEPRSEHEGLDLAELDREDDGTDESTR